MSQLDEILKTELSLIVLEGKPRCTCGNKKEHSNNLFALKQISFEDDESPQQLEQEVKEIFMKMSEILEEIWQQDPPNINQNDNK